MHLLQLRQQKPEAVTRLVITNQGPTHVHRTIAVTHQRIIVQTHPLKERALTDHRTQQTATLIRPIEFLLLQIQAVPQHQHGVIAPKPEVAQVPAALLQPEAVTLHLLQTTQGQAQEVIRHRQADQVPEVAPEVIPLVQAVAIVEAVVQEAVVQEAVLAVHQAVVEGNCII